MVIKLSLCLLLLLAACAAPMQAAPEMSAPAYLPVETAEPESKGADAGSNVILTVWNREQPEVRRIDMASAREAPGYVAIRALPHRLSPGGEKLAAVESNGESCEPFAGGTSCRGNAAVLHLIDLQSWQEVTATVSTNGWASAMAFSPDASQLALAYTNRDESVLVLYDTATGGMAARLELNFRPSRLGFTAGGRQVVVYGQASGENPGISEPEPPRILLLDAATLAVQWDQELDWVQSGYWCRANCEASHELPDMVSWEPAVVLSQDGSRLYIVHAGEEMLTAVDFFARSASRLRIRERQSWLERILALAAGTALAKGELDGAQKSAALSADGKHLYVVGHAYNARTNGEPVAYAADASLGLKNVDIETGVILASRAAQGSRILVSPSGASILIEDWTQGQPLTQVFDAESLEPIAQMEGWEVRLSRRVDGRPVLLASQAAEYSTRLAVVDPETYEITQPWTIENYVFWPDSQ